MRYKKQVHVVKVTTLKCTLTLCDLSSCYSFDVNKIMAFQCAFNRNSQKKMTYEGNSENYFA